MSMDPHTFAWEYEFRADEGDYTPTEGERAMIEDAICGYLSHLPAPTDLGQEILDTLQTELECLLEDLGTAEQSAVEGLMARINRIEAVIEKAGRS